MATKNHQPAAAPAEKPRRIRLGRNRAQKARRNGRRQVMFEISDELDDILEKFRRLLTKRLREAAGKLARAATRVQAFEYIGRVAAKAEFGRGNEG